MVASPYFFAFLHDDASGLGAIVARLSTLAVASVGVTDSFITRMLNHCCVYLSLS